MSVRLVCFDLGGVVVRLCRSWDEGCLAAGVELRRADRTENDERRRRAAVEDYQRGALACEAFFQTVAETFRGAYSPGEVRRVHDAWILREYEGVEPIVHALHERSVETACLSNTNAGHWASLERWPTVRVLGRRFASHEMGVSKPDEAIYKAFEEATGRSGAEILFFEDTEPNAEAARGLGWRAHVVDPSDETAPQIERALREHGLL